MRSKAIQVANLAGGRVDYRLRISPTAKKLRVRVGIASVEVILPRGRPVEDVEHFLRANEQWLLSQIDRMSRLAAIRRIQQVQAGAILFNGVLTAVVVEEISQRGGSNVVRWDGRRIVIVRGRGSVTTPARSLENWLRRQAREGIERHLRTLLPQVKVAPQRLYVMGQRTKWGNCSSMGNLSFNWRLVMAPEFVLRYIVTHEAVHLAIPDHSAKFWLTVQSLCRDTERAKQWLAAEGWRLHEPIAFLGDHASPETTGGSGRPAASAG